MRYLNQYFCELLYADYEDLEPEDLQAAPADAAKFSRTKRVLPAV